MRRLFVSVAKNSTELPRLLLCLQVNSSNQVQIVRITKESPKLKILTSHSTRLAPEHLGLFKNIADWYFQLVVFPGEPLLFEVLPEAQPYVPVQKCQCHIRAVCQTKKTLEWDQGEKSVGVEGYSEQKASTYYPYLFPEDLRSPIKSFPQ